MISNKPIFIRVWPTRHIPVKRRYTKFYKNLTIVSDSQRPTNVLSVSGVYL
jgi:hypothetical protein